MWLGQTFWGKYANKVRLLLFLNVINLKKNPAFNSNSN